MEGEFVGVFGTGSVDNYADTRSTKRATSSAISRNNPDSHSHVFYSEVQDGHHDSTLFPPRGPVVVSPKQSDLTNEQKVNRGKVHS